MSRTSSLLVAAALLAAGAAGAQAPTPAKPGAPLKAAPAPAKPTFALFDVPEMKGAHDEIAKAAKAVKSAQAANKQNFRLAVTLLLAADKARAAKDLATAKALAKESAAAATAAAKLGAGALPLDAIKAKNPKFGPLLLQAEPQVPQANLLADDPEGWSRHGFAPNSADRPRDGQGFAPNSAD
jgi:hypothetical protein